MFAVETYRVSSYLERFTGETRPSRTLELTGPLPCHGIRNRATLAFSPSFDGVWSSPVAGYLTDGGLAGLSVVGWFPLAECPFYYDFRDAGATSGSLRRVGLGTSAERVGEGPSDSDASIGATMTARLVALREGVVPMPTAQDLPQRAGEDGGELSRAWARPPRKPTPSPFLR